MRASKTAAIAAAILIIAAVAAFLLISDRDLPTTTVEGWERYDGRPVDSRGVPNSSSPAPSRTIRKMVRGGMDIISSLIVLLAPWVVIMTIPGKREEPLEGMIYGGFSIAAWIVNASGGWWLLQPTLVGWAAIHFFLTVLTVLFVRQKVWIQAANTTVFFLIWLYMVLIM